MELIRLPQAARELGVSYPTLKQWIYRRRIRSVRTAGGHHRIPRTEIERLLFRRGSNPAGHRRQERRQPARRPAKSEPVTGLERYISGRNQLVGRVTSVQAVGLLAKVLLDIGGQKVTAIITRDACRDLGLKTGDSVAALIKATEVMIIRAPAAKSYWSNSSAARYTAPED